jgi:hypothetical protein
LKLLEITIARIGSFTEEHLATVVSRLTLADHRFSLKRGTLLFGAEPPLQLNREELKEFDEYAAARLKAQAVRALKAFAILAVNILCIVPFSAGHRLHSHWEVAKFLVISAEVFFLWFVLKMGLVWASWQSSRETRREFEIQD